VTPEEIYRQAYHAAYDALTPHNPLAQARDVIAEAVAAYVVGSRNAGVKRWQEIADDPDRRRDVVNALVRDLSQHESLRLPPHNVLDGIVQAVAAGLVAAEPTGGQS
jgi:hypothetical protein